MKFMTSEWLKAAELDLMTMKEIKDIELINQLYIESRYPSNLGLLPTGRPSAKQAQIFYETAYQIYNDVKQFLENQSQGG